MYVFRKTDPRSAHRNDENSGTDRTLIVRRATGLTSWKASANYTNKRLAPRHLHKRRRCDAGKRERDLCVALFIPAFLMYQIDGTQSYAVINDGDIEDGVAAERVDQFVIKEIPLDIVGVVADKTLLID